MKPAKNTIQHIIPEANPLQLKALYRLINDDVVGAFETTDGAFADVNEINGYCNELKAQQLVNLRALLNIEEE